jgi:hypothetical protein
MEADKKTGVRFQKYGHTSDTLDYFLTTYFAGKYNEFLHGDSTSKRVALRAKDVTNF